MIILDLNQVMISNLMKSLDARNNQIEEGLIRHMVLNSIRSNRNKFVDEYGELVIACDDKQYWRRTFFPYYKAGRKKTREKSPIDWNKVFDILNRVRDELKEYFPYRVIQIEHAEADDVIGSLCRKFGVALGGNPILILSGDKDFIQLQRYSNVSQYDPINKRWLSNSDPDRFLLEHIMKGDAGDGIPNFFSSDDSFVAGIRQKRMTQKKMDMFIEQMKTKSADEVFSPELYRNWMRNKKLIDLSCIPDNVYEQVMNSYNAQENKGRNRLFDYFIKNKLKNLTEYIGEF